jgi:hypothetical protein
LGREEINQYRTVASVEGCAGQNDSARRPGSIENLSANHYILIGAKRISQHTGTRLGSGGIQNNCCSKRKEVGYESETHV